MKQQIQENKDLSYEPASQEAQNQKKGLLQFLSQRKHILIVLFIVAAVIGYWICTVVSFRGGNLVLSKKLYVVFAKNALVTYLAILLCYIFWGRQFWRRNALRALVNLIAVSITLFLVELPAAVGLVDYRRLIVPKMIGAVGPHNKQFESGLYYHRPPYDKFTNAVPGDTAFNLGLKSNRRYIAEHCYDKNGFRNDRDMECTSVVLIGDSFVEGYKVTQEKIISTQLSQLLGVDVSNLGQCDFGPKQELAVLRILGIELQPSVVIWFFCEGNDLHDYEQQEGNRKWYVKKYDNYKTRSLFCNLLIAASIHTNRLLYRWQNRALRRSARLVSLVEDHNDIMYFGGKKPCPVTENKLAQFEKCQEIIMEAKTICDRNRIKFLLVYIPQKFRIYYDYLMFPKESIIVDWTLNDFPGRFARWAESASISFLDLTPSLKRAANEGLLVYYLDDEHWTEKGHEVVTQQVAGFIHQEGWLDKLSPELDCSKFLSE